MLIALPFVSPYVAAGFVFSVGTGFSTLIRLQQLAIAIGAAAGVARINRRAAREQRNGLRRSAVVSQCAECGVGVVQVAVAVEIAGAIAAQVVAVRVHGAIAVSLRTIRDDAILKRCRPGDPTARTAISAVHDVVIDRAVADDQCALADVEDTPAISKFLLAVITKAAGGGVSVDRAVVDGQTSSYLVYTAAVNPAANKPNGRPIAAYRASVDGERSLIADAATIDCLIVADRAVVDGQYSWKTMVEDSASATGSKKAAAAGLIPAHDAVVNRQVPLVDDAAAGLCKTILDCHLGKSYGAAVICDNSIRSSAINNGGLGTGTDHLQGFADGEILDVGRGGDHDGIAGRSQRDGMPDGLACGLR